MATSFDAFVRQLREITPPVPWRGDGLDKLDRTAEEVAQTLVSLPEVSRASVASAVRDHGDWVPLLALCVGLTQEQLKNQLRHRFGSASWRNLAQTCPDELVAFLDQRFGLIEALREQRERTWSFAEVLRERLRWSRRRGVSSTVSGRVVEDAVERVLRELRLPYTMRTTFEGQAKQHAPCDFAVPKGGPEALIVGAAKGFDSTGSKLTDAWREVEQMAKVRLPRQYIFVVVDGIGWRNRLSDLKRIWMLKEQNSVDGLYNLSMLDQFRADLKEAAHRLGLI